MEKTCGRSGVESALESNTEVWSICDSFSCAV